MSRATHHIGILGGSGLYPWDGLTDVVERRVFTPFGEASDLIVSGQLGDTRVYFLPRHGRGHRLPPHRVNYRANLYALKWSGARQIVSVSAVGSLREDMHPGELVLVDQYIDWTHGRASTFFEDDTVVAHVSLADPTDAALSACLARAAERSGVKVHHRGTYLCLEGPQFSTRAESQLYRSWGAHVVGMTDMPEAKLAREAELPYASLAMITHHECWHDGEATVSVDSAAATLNESVNRACALLTMIQDWPNPEHSPAASALAQALITPKSAISPVTREKLSLLIGKYVD